MPRDFIIGQRWVYSMGQYIREYLQGYASDLRNLLQENLASGSNGTKEYRRDISLFQELCLWMKDENETKVDE